MRISSRNNKACSEANYMYINIYISFFPEHASSAVFINDSCIKDVFSWLVANKLSANTN